MFVEDIYYSDMFDFDILVLGVWIDVYVVGWGWSVKSVECEELGVLLVVFGGDFEVYWWLGGVCVVKVGMCVGMFYLIIGYLLFDVVCIVVMLVECSDFGGVWLYDVIYDLVCKIWGECGFYCVFDIMLFCVVEFEECYCIFECFYCFLLLFIGCFYVG